MKQTLEIGTPVQSKSGTHTCSISGDVLVYDLDPAKLSKPIADEAAEVVRGEVKAIPERPTAGTLKARRREGVSSTALFVSSGKLLGSIAAAVVDGASAAVTIAADRLTDPKLFDRFVQLMPALREPASLMSRPSIARARERAMAALTELRKGRR